MLERYAAAFPLWAIALSGVAWWQPALFAPLGSSITPLLGLVMLCMGLGLRTDDFKLVVTRPRIVLFGAALQFLIMPAAAWLVARVLALPPALATGVILVGCCPGGTASNVIAYLAKADVALSITLTATTTVLAVVFTPWLATWYIGTRAPVPTWALLFSVLEIVLVPVVVGTLINTFFGRHSAKLQPVLPAITVTAIALIIGTIVALNQSSLRKVGFSVVAAVILHNALGLTAGHVGARLLGADERARRTLIVEIGMQNSGLGVALAKEYFSMLSALPGAVFSVWHNLTGAWLAWRWSRR